MTKTEEVLRKLMKLPHRGSSTKNERVAAEILLNEYEDLGLKAELQFFKTIHRSGVIEFAVPALTLSLGFILYRYFNELVGIYTIIIGLILYFKYPVNFVDFIKPLSKAQSQNVVSLVDTKKYNKTLILAAHYDTAIEMIYMRLIGKIYNKILGGKPKKKKAKIDSDKVPFFLKTPLIISNFGIFILVITVIFNLEHTLLDIYLWGIAIYCVMFSVLVVKAGYVPGAFDNGVATAMLIELADYFNKNMLENTKLVFLNTGCEEDAIKGITYFLEDNDIDHENTYFLNFESIGAEIPVITYAEADLWTGWPMKYDKEAYEFAKKVKDSNPKFSDFHESYIPAPSDMIVAVDKHYKVVTEIASLSPEGFPEQYHQKTDTMKLLKWDSINLSKEYAIELIEKFDAEFKQNP